ncbi:MAG: PAS domain S-box protein [Pirellulaceae bacterium]|nr:PAS domain S-box protein [Pirellulaceae bacterium]
MRRIEAIQIAATDRLNVVEIVEAFFSGSEFVERDEFHVFVTPLLPRYQGVTALGWAPLVLAEERVSHEEAARGEGLSEYRIHEQRKGKIAPAAARNAYYPILYIEPKDRDQHRLGFDLNSDAACRKAIVKTLSTGLPAAAVCAPSKHGISGNKLLYVVAPILKSAPAAKYPADLSDIEGVVFGIFDINAIIRATLDSLPPQDIDLYITDPLDGGNEPICYFPSEASRATMTKAATLERASIPPSGSKVTGLLKVANRTGEVVCLPSHSYLAKQRSWQPTIALCTGLVVTGLLTGFVYLLTESTARVRRLVALRTRELRDSEQRFRRLVDNAGDAFFLHDASGRILDVNQRASESLGYSREELLQMAVSDIDTYVPPGEPLDYWKLADDEYPITFEGVHRRKDGSTFPVELRLVPLVLDRHRLMFGLARDISERKRAEEEVFKEQRLLRELLDLQEQDRKLISYEIHDGLAQQLTGANMQLQAVGHMLERDPGTARKMFDGAVRLLGEAMAETRRLIGGLRPPVLDESGVVAAIEELIVQYKQNGPEIEFDHNIVIKRFSPPLESALFRIVQESLTNACRYSQSEKVRVELTLALDNVTIDVRDWGVGFDPAQVAGNHFGLRGIRERARLLRGSAEIESSPGQGTHIRVVLPLSLAFENNILDEHQEGD